MAARREYTFDFIQETADLAGLALYADNWKQLDELQLTDPTLYRKVLRLAWLRTVGLDFKHIPSDKLTTVKSVDETIRKHNFVNS
jgi:hypothetical protein